MMRSENYIEAFQAYADASLDLWDATWGTPADVVTSAREMHRTVTAAFDLPPAVLPQETLHAMSSAAEDALLELRTVVPDIFCGDGYGTSARLVFEAIKMFEDHLVNHPAPRRTLLTTPARTPELVH